MTEQSRQEDLERRNQVLQSELDVAVTILQTIGVLVVVLDTEGCIVKFNSACERLTGYTYDEVKGKPLWDLFLFPEEQETVKAVFRQLRAGMFPNEHENYWRTKDGRRRMIAWSNTALVDDVGKVALIIGTGTDITERKKSEEALKASEKRFRLVLDATSDGMWDRCLITEETYYGANWASVLGYSEEDLNTGKISWQGLLHPEDKDDAVAAVQDHIKGRTSRYVKEFRLKNKSGNWQWILAKGKVVEWDDDGEPLRFVGTHTDITNRKLMEEALKKSSEQTKMFAYSVAHDLKNPAVSIYGLMNRFQRKYDEMTPEKRNTYCDRLMRDSEQIVSLVDKVNTYISSKENSLHIERVSLLEIVGIIYEEFSLQLNVRNAEWKVAKDLPEIRADRISLLRILRNLVDNALKYGGVQLTAIAIGHKETEKHHVISVWDNGVGLEKEESKSIFRAFKRKKTSVGICGTGLGLAIVKEIAEQHKGEVWVEHGLKKGIAFCFSISKFL